MFSGFSAQKLKPQLKMACGRIQIASNKKAALLKQSMREVALMLAEDPPKEEKAKIRAEALIRDDNMIEAYEILQLECELLHERIKLIQYSKTCPQDLVSVISTLIWASHRVDIEELNLIRKQFSAKYGKVFVENAMRNVGGVLNERVVSKLSIEPPAAYLVQTYLERICEQFHVDWTPSMKLASDALVEPMAPPSGYSVPVAQGTGLGPSHHPGPIATTPNYAASTGADDQTISLPPEAPSNVPPAMPTAPSFKKNMFDEPEIFVPGGAKQSKDDDKEDGGEDGGDDDEGDEALRSSLADLQAKFNELKK